MTKVRISYFGMDGEGRNLTEAKKDAGNKIEKALAGSYTPEILTHRGYAVLLYREPSGWASRLIADPQRGLVGGHVYGSSIGTYERVKQSTLLNLAQLGWEPKDGLDAPEFVRGREMVNEFTGWVRFQMRYAFARNEKGLSDFDAHAYAGCDPSRPELWLPEGASA